MPFRSPYPDVEIPPLTLPELIFGRARQFGDKPALVDGVTGLEISYARLVSLVDRLAGQLARRGVRPGEVVAIFAPNAPHYAVAFHAILRAGAVVSTVNSLYTPDELASQLRDCAARMLFTVSPFLDRVAVAAQRPGVRVAEVVVLDETAAAAADGTEDTAESGETPQRGYRSSSLAELLAAEPVTGEGPGAGPGEGPREGPGDTADPATTLAVLPYSSGTTGSAKGVMLTHRNLVANLVQSQVLLTLDQNSRVLAVLPFFHIYGMTLLMNHALYAGATIVTLPRFSLETFLRAIEQYRTNRVYIVPPIAVALAKDPMVEQFDLSAVELMLSGAAPLDAGLAEAVRARLGCRIRQGYGMTEMSPVSHAIPDDRDDVPIGTVGFTLPNMECKILCPGTGRELGAGEVGELCCRGPNVMTGYLNNPHATATTLDADGYLHTGDLAKVDAQGCVTIVDRVKELIKYKGYQVPPAELEALLLTHPGIADVAVVGVRDADGEEVPKAFVVRQRQPEGTPELTEDEVIRFVAQRVSPHKKVRMVQFVEQIPRSPSGKILRRNLRAGAAAKPGSGR